MSWHDKYLDQAATWRTKAQIHASKGEATAAQLAMRCAEVYERLALAAVDKPDQNDKM